MVHHEERSWAGRRIVRRFSSASVRTSIVRCIAVWITLSSLLFSGRATAQDSVPVVLNYSAPARCPSRARFVERLRMHTQRLQLSDDPNALRLDVRIVRRSTGYNGELEVTRAGGVPGRRGFEDADCREVASALALSAALSIDPEATLTVPPDASSNDNPEGEGPSVAPESGGSPEGRPKRELDEQAASSDNRSGGAAEARSDDDGATAELEQPDEGVGAGALWSLGPQVVGDFAFQPKAAVGGGLVFGVRDQTERHVLPLELALAATYLTSRMTRGDDPLLLDWWAIDFRFCPLRGGGSFTVLLCGSGQAGLLWASGVDVEEPQQAMRSFFSAGLGLWGRQTLSDHWEITGLVDFRIPLVDRAFALDPDLQVVSSSRPIGVSVAIGALYGF